MAIIIDISRKRWLSEEEAVAYTTVGRDTLRMLRDTDQLDYISLGRFIKYERKDLDDMMEKLTRHSKGKIKKCQLKFS